MTVYVDDMMREAKVRRLTAKWSHLLADTHDELVAFASELGLQARWIQKEGTPHEHFDVTAQMRDRALRMGAKPMSYLRETGDFIAAKRAALNTALPAPAAVLEGVERAAPPPAEPEKPLPRWNPDRPRHSWLELREHWSRCRHCELEAENAFMPLVGKWVRWWHWPDGDLTVQIPGPPCPGPPE